MNMGVRHTSCPPPDTCRVIKEASCFFTYENATFIDSVRTAPFVSSSATLDYSEALGPIQVPYVDPPMDFADSPPAPMNDMNLYSFSTSLSPEAIDLTPPTKKKDKGKRPFHRAKFPRKVSKKSSPTPTTEKPDRGPLTTPPPMSPLPSTSQPFNSYPESESD
jgi:hypothetical protein